MYCILLGITMPNTIRLSTSSGSTSETVNAHRVLVRSPEGRRPCGRCRK